MGQMIDGVWDPVDRTITAADGSFQRRDSSFRGTIATATPGRYRLYVSLACPWAHRTLIFRTLKGLEAAIPVSVTHWLMADQGWNFAPGDGVVPDPEAAAALHEIYARADAHYSGRVTVPVLWDHEAGAIVNNESAEIIRIFNAIGPTPGDFYPEALRPQIDAMNARVYETVNNGVYRAGFATTQAAYDAAVGALFESLDWLEARLAAQPYLCGATLTEADWRLFPTLIRFDAVYVAHFKCNVRRLQDYPALQAYTKRLYRMPGIAETCDFGHIKRHYFQSHRHLNPSGIVPDGPLLEF